MRGASADDDGGRLAPRFLGGFRLRGACSAWLLAGADGSLAVCPCGFVFRGVRGARRVRAMGRLVCWRICGAVVGRRRWSEGLDAALEKYQSDVDASSPIAAE